jgi:hypothetical protein
VLLNPRINLRARHVELVLPPRRRGQAAGLAVVPVEFAPRQTGDLMPTRQLTPISLLKVKSSAAPYINDASAGIIHMYC